MIDMCMCAMMQIGMCESPQSGILTNKSLKIVVILIRSYYQSFGSQLIPFSGNFQSQLKLGTILFHLKYPVIAHDSSIEPCIIYANAKALDLWARCWEEMIGMPSKLTAPKEEHLARKSALDTVKKNNPIKNYQGIRINSEGEKFIIRNAHIWSLQDDQGIRCGQAATFDDWCKVELK